LALASVLALILVLSWVRRSFASWVRRSFAPAALQGRKSGLLVIHETLAIDARRRLHLVEVKGTQALLLTGGSSDILTAWPAKPDGV